MVTLGKRKIHVVLELLVLEFLKHPLSFVRDYEQSATYVA